MACSVLSVHVLEVVIEHLSNDDEVLGKLLNPLDIHSLACAHYRFARVMDRIDARREQLKRWKDLTALQIATAVGRLMEAERVLKANSLIFSQLRKGFEAHKRLSREYMRASFRREMSEEAIKCLFGSNEIITCKEPISIGHEVSTLGVRTHVIISGAFVHIRSKNKVHVSFVGKWYKNDNSVPCNVPELGIAVAKYFKCYRFNFHLEQFPLQDDFIDAYQHYLNL